MSKKVTLEDLMNDRGFMVQQHKYENARVATTNGYSWASKIYQAGTSVETFITLARRLRDEYLKDLNETFKVLEVEEVKEANESGIIKPTGILRPA